MAMEIITTQKGGETLIWQGCKFTLNRKVVNGKKYWRCAKRICPARITTEGNEVLQQTNGHNHPVDGVEREEKIKSAGERNIDSYISAIRHCVVAFDF